MEVGAGGERGVARGRAQHAAFGELPRRVFGISVEAARFDRLGFRCDEDGVRARLEASGRSFLAGYHAALEERTAASVASRLDGLEPEFKGFGFEGAGMALSLLDSLTPWRRRVDAFLVGPGSSHAYLVHVGIGWAIARVPWLRLRIEWPLARLDPLLRWLLLNRSESNHACRKV